MNVDLEVFDYKIIEIIDNDVLTALSDTMNYPKDRDFIQVGIRKDFNMNTAFIQTIITIPFGLAGIKSHPNADTIVFANKTNYRVNGATIDDKLVLAELFNSHLSRVAEFIAINVGRYSLTNMGYCFNIPSLAKSILICESASEF